jgi:putative FmdB family regulatory protein
MPIYEYRCSSCGHELEALQKFSDAPLSTCPACQRDALTKKVSLAGFQLKGSGWYVTDFKGGGAKPAAKSGNGDGTAGAAGTEGKSETKAETKTEADTKTKTETKSESTSTAPTTSSTPGSTAGS